MSWQRQVLRFCLGGGLGLVLYYAALYGLTEWVGMWYMGSAIVGSVANYTSNFLCHKFWTFKNPALHLMHIQAALYVCVIAILFVTNLGLLYAFVEFLRLPYIGAQLIVTFIVTVMSFFLTRRIFTRKTR